MSVYVAACDLGMGVFAARRLRRRELILVMGGSVIDTSGHAVRGADHCNALQVGLNTYVDLACPGVKVNHSCRPNAGLLADGVRLVALRDIAAGTEIRFDYSTSVHDDPWTMQCRCDAADCRGTIAAFNTLPHGV